MQPYFTHRMLSQSPALAPLAAIVADLRERLDGSGYPRGISGASISRPARILAAVDVYQAMREPRPCTGPRARQTMQRACCAKKHGPAGLTTRS